MGITHGLTADVRSPAALNAGCCITTAVFFVESNTTDCTLHANFSVLSPRWLLRNTGVDILEIHLGIYL